ncbi:exoribonuclease R [Rubidibacter lacunae KORDI 51-2]|uniref:Exoribonuclease R n=1 Tax=Rubidibacter lacunae KORDI 51-2 TaxID=582515 RepID=U5DGX6_9CHRO|nr:ribonuclease R family protein [Rubidibacter lacunae]ERN40851.1 exoribonuclease R [Rubidibacter lacunae KORDI 51-2]
MEFSIATLLSHLSEDKLIAPKVLEKKLDCQDFTTLERLQIALDALERIGIVDKERGKYRRLPHEDTVEARLRCSSKGFCFAIQDAESAEDIYVRESYLGSAWNGDRVLVRVTKEGSRRRSPEGEVQVILERANPAVLAQVKQTDTGFRAVPLDDRLLFELGLVCGEDEDDIDPATAVGKLVHVEVMRYPLGDAPPKGRILRILGSDAEEAADTDIVCCKHYLRRQFPAAVEQALDDMPDGFDPAELGGRRDLRELLTLAFADLSETERVPAAIETAYSLEPVDNELWRLGIHMADVASWVPLDGAIAAEARLRGTATFLGDLVLPLFPEAVAERYSLEPESDRLATSLFLTLDAMGAVVSFELVQSVVCVDRLLDYREAQSLLGRQDAVAADLAPVVAVLDDLFFKLSPLVKAQRQQDGAFELELPERLSLFPDEGRTGALVTSPALPVRALLGELALPAGRALSRHFQALELPGIYRTQVAPDSSDLEDAIAFGNNSGLTLALESETEVKPQDYQNFSQQLSKSSAPQVLAFLLEKTLPLPKYSYKPGSHFGLACSDGYMSCLAPGQRYADFYVQHVLKALLEQGRDRRHSRAKEGVDLGSSDSHGKINWNVLPTQLGADLEVGLSGLVSDLNNSEKIAEDAETDLIGLKKAEQMKERTGQVFDGWIVGVQTYGFFVEIEELLVEGLVHVSSLKDDWYEYRARHTCLVGRKNRIAYRLGSRVKVRVKSVDYYRQQIDLVTVNDGSQETMTDLLDDDGNGRDFDPNRDAPSGGTGEEE